MTPVLALELLAFAGGAAAAVLTPGWDQWSFALFVVLVVFSIVSDATAVSMGNKLYVSGSALGLVLAAVVMGGGPAAALGVIVIGTGWIRHRSEVEFGHVVANLANYTVFPLVAVGIVFRGLTQALAVGPRNPTVLPPRIRRVSSLALRINFLATASHGCYQTPDGPSAEDPRSAHPPAVCGALLRTADDGRRLPDAADWE